MKRLLREAFWAAADGLPAGHDFVLVARPDAGELARSAASGVAEALARAARGGRAADGGAGA